VLVAVGRGQIDRKEKREKGGKKDGVGYNDGGGVDGDRMMVLGSGRSPLFVMPYEERRRWRRRRIAFGSLFFLFTPGGNSLM